MVKTRAMCDGCYDDFYNGKRGTGCWHFDSAKVVTRTWVGTWQPPPYVWNPVEILSCCTRRGQSALKRDDCRMVESPEAAVALRKKWDAENARRTA